MTENKSIALELIAAERKRQIVSEGWTPAHDDQHVHGELSKAAACYANSSLKEGHSNIPYDWPWSKDWWKPTPDDRIRELVKAGALIVAEIDRISRVPVSKTSMKPMTERGTDYRQNDIHDDPPLIDLAGLQWREPSLDQRWQDGTQILAAVLVRDSRTNSTYWDYSVVTVEAGEGYFEITIDGEAWGWEYHQISKFAVLSGRVSEPPGE